MTKMTKRTAAEVKAMLATMATATLVDVTTGTKYLSSCKVTDEPNVVAAAAAKFYGVDASAMRVERIRSLAERD